jgi:hypothetical protein
MIETKITKETDPIEVRYLLGGWSEQTWTGTLAEAIQIAKAEIAEHAGGYGSAAYAFANAVFEALLKGGQGD